MGRPVRSSVVFMVLEPSLTHSLSRLQHLGFPHKASYSEIQFSLETLRSHLPDSEVLASLEAWLSTSAGRQCLFELASELVLDDYDAVMTLISQEWEDQDWIQDK